MAKITRSKLKNIIQEEIENTLVDEGLLDTFKALGSGLKKFYKDAEVTGEIEASKKATQAAGRQLADRRDRFRDALKRETDPERKKRIEQEIDTLDAMIKGLGRGGSEAEEVHAALADVSDGKMEDTENEFVRAAKRAAATAERIKAGAAKEDGEETPEVAPAVKKVALAVPDDVLQVVINYLAQEPSYQNIKLVDLKDKMDKEEGLYKLDLMGRRLAAHTKKNTRVAEGKTTITRQALKEVLSLLTEDGL